MTAAARPQRHAPAERDLAAAGARARCSARTCVRPAHPRRRRAAGGRPLAAGPRRARRCCCRWRPTASSATYAARLPLLRRTRPATRADPRPEVLAGAGDAGRRPRTGAGSTAFAAEYRDALAALRLQRATARRRRGRSPRHGPDPARWTGPAASPRLRHPRRPPSDHPVYPTARGRPGLTAAELLRVRARVRARASRCAGSPCRRRRSPCTTGGDRCPALLAGALRPRPAGLDRQPCRAPRAPADAGGRCWRTARHRPGRRACLAERRYLDAGPPCPCGPSPWPATPARTSSCRWPPPRWACSTAAPSSPARSSTAPPAQRLLAAVTDARAPLRGPGPARRRDPLRARRPRAARRPGPPLPAGLDGCRRGCRWPRCRAGRPGRPAGRSTTSPTASTAATRSRCSTPPHPAAGLADHAVRLRHRPGVPPAEHLAGAGRRRRRAPGSGCCSRTTTGPRITPAPAARRARRGRARARRTSTTRGSSCDDDGPLADLFTTITVHLCAGRPRLRAGRRGRAPLDRLLGLVRDRLDQAARRLGAGPASPAPPAGPRSRRRPAAGQGDGDRGHPARPRTAPAPPTSTSTTPPAPTTCSGATDDAGLRRRAQPPGRGPPNCPRADQAVAHTLLNCLLREVCGARAARPRSTDGHLLLRLPRAGYALRVALRRTSLLGAHRFAGPVAEDAGRRLERRSAGGGWPSSSHAELDACAPACANDEFLAQVAASHARRRRRARAAAAGAPAATRTPVPGLRAVRWSPGTASTPRPRPAAASAAAWRALRPGGRRRASRCGCSRSASDAGRRGAASPARPPAGPARRRCRAGLPAAARAPLAVRPAAAPPGAGGRPAAAATSRPRRRRHPFAAPPRCAPSTTARRLPEVQPRTCGSPTACARTPGTSCPARSR